MSKDEMNDLQEPRMEDPALERVIGRIRKEYERNLMRPDVRKPLAAAIYKVWKEVDHSEVPRVRKQQDAGERLAKV